jgi:hypothetical protein
MWLTALNDALAAATAAAAAAAAVTTAAQRRVTFAGGDDDGGGGGGSSRRRERPRAPAAAIAGLVTLLADATSNGAARDRSLLRIYAVLRYLNVPTLIRAYDQYVVARLSLVMSRHFVLYLLARTLKPQP